MAYASKGCMFKDFVSGGIIIGNSYLDLKID